jgi:hypothetical protein
MAVAALVLLAIFAVLPRVIFGSSYADMRLGPYIFAVAIIGIRATARADRRFLRQLAVAGTAFLLVRAAGNSVSLLIYDRSYQREAAAIDHIPRGARLVSFVGRACAIRWWASRLEHFPALALERKLAFSNDQWDMAGGPPLSVAYAAADGYARVPSETVVPNDCHHHELRTIGQSLRGFPRAAFDYVWLIQPPPFDAKDLVGLQPVWQSGGSALYRVVDRRQPPAGEQT